MTAVFPHPDEIIRYACQHFDITTDEMLTNTRRALIVGYRRVTCVACVQITNFSHADIAEYFGMTEYWVRTTVYTLKSCPAEIRAVDRLVAAWNTQ